MQYNELELRRKLFMNPEQIIEDIQRGLLNWYPFKANADILYISDKEDCLSDMLKE